MQGFLHVEDDIEVVPLSEFESLRDLANEALDLVESLAFYDEDGYLNREAVDLLCKAGRMKRVYKLTKPQKIALQVVKEGRVWVWKGGTWGQARGCRVRRDVLDRLLADKLIEIDEDGDKEGTRSVSLTAAGTEQI